MSTELESKISVSSHEPVRGRLRAAGAAYVGRVLEINRILDDADGRLLRDGCGLRIRRVDVLDGRGSKPTVTFKGRKMPGRFKQREEWESEIDDADALASILAGLGFTDRIVFEKRRESWRLGSCAVELDEVPKLGLFVEVEGPDEAGIDAVLGLLELSDQPSIQESYIALLTAGEPIEPGAVRSYRFE